MTPPVRRLMEQLRRHLEDAERRELGDDGETRLVLPESVDEGVLAKLLIQLDAALRTPDVRRFAVEVVEAGTTTSETDASLVGAVTLWGRVDELAGLGTSPAVLEVTR